MSLLGALGIAGSGLSDVSLGLSVVSQNVANASTPQYALETLSQTSQSAAGQEFGVRSGLVVLASDPALQNQTALQASDAAADNTTSAALATLEPVLGTVGSGNDLGSQLTAVQTAFSALLADPSDTIQQNAVVSAASGLCSGINTLAAAYGAARQNAQTGVVSGVAQLNTALAALGGLNKQIVSDRALGISTADLENQRAQQENAITQLVGARFVGQPDGSVTVLSSGGAQLPTDGSQTLSIAASATGPTDYYPGGGIGGIELGGADITAQMTGGTIGANLALRDSVLPKYQAGLDEFAENLSTRFAGQGLTLFTGATGTVPTSTGPATQTGYVGYANTIEVNPAVSANAALVRDGTNAIAGSAGGPSAFTPNPTGLAGFTTLIERVLNFALGAQAQAGVSQSPIATTGLGPAGNLSSGASQPATLADAANTLTASQAGDSHTATAQAADSQAVAASLQTKLKGTTGVDMDTELGQLVVLQNAYGANAKIISAVQAMFLDTLNMVT